MKNNESTASAATTPSTARIAELITRHTGIHKMGFPDEFKDLERLVNAVIDECPEGVADPVPPGWQLVPIAPTHSMLDAAQFHTEHTDVEVDDTGAGPAFARGDKRNYRARGQAAAVYGEMLRAAPPTPAADHINDAVEMALARIAEMETANTLLINLRTAVVDHIAMFEGTSDEFNMTATAIQQALAATITKEPT